MEFEKGDLLDLFYHKKIDILVHGCNCFNTMGAGIAKKIKEIYIDAYNADLLTVKGDKNKLGTYSISKINETQYIINAYTQYYYFGKRPLNYEALRNVFKLINKNFNNMIIGIPKIGAGLAKGDWNIIKNIIEEETTNNKLICVYL
tara:strand:+ start:604 stop:1041 length:438 start_codon:yes stop_codon:yes gene_type:complete